jgi:carboxyl-terminal processing protease
MRVKRAVLAPILVALVALATGGWFLQQGAGSERNLYANSRLLEEILEYVSEGFVDEKQAGELYQMAIDGMLQELGDPHTSFIPAKEYEDLRIQLQGDYGGIGISINRRNGWVTVINPLPDTPGERAGLRAGDAIIEVDGESTKGWSDDFAVSKLRGPRGEKVTLTIARPGVDEPLRFDIVRAEIHVKSVPATFMLSPDVGYVELTVFSETSTAEVRDAIRVLRDQGARGVVLDMRGNSGGLLEQGVSVSDLFLKQDQLVVETKGRIPQQNYRIQASHADEFEGLPIVLLVGPNSASATEIVAGALQDHDRALVLGQITYGKGSVQSLVQLSTKDWLRLTTARWYTPSGRSIQAPYGIDGPVLVESSDSAAAAAEKPEYRTDAGRVVFGGGGIHPDLTVLPDTLTAQERPLVQELQQQSGEYFEARFAFGVRFNAAALQPGFEVTDQMVNEFYDALMTAGVVLDRETYDQGSRWIRVQLADEITRSKFGYQEWRKRLNTDDPQVRAAVQLLRDSRTPEQLFVAARQWERANGGPGTPGSN